jgi:hypothetical protein
VYNNISTSNPSVALIHRLTFCNHYNRNPQTCATTVVGLYNQPHLNGDCQNADPTWGAGTGNDCKDDSNETYNFWTIIERKRDLGDKDYAGFSIDGSLTSFV